MYREIGERDNGKTKRLLEYAKKHKAIVVCSMPRAMEEKAREYGLGKIECISYTVFLDNAKKLGTEPIVIDEIENFLTHINPHIDGYTLGVEKNEI